jgi:uncharacterized NAD(P)/FAD-binding protein YdhS
VHGQDQLETDYLVVGAGATGVAFVDSLIEHSDADVVIVERRHRAGGHWLDAYPFVQLHQPSATYGVNSTLLGLDRIEAHEHDVLAYGTTALSRIDGLRLTGTARHKEGILSFVMDGIHPHDVGTIVDREGIAIRTGHHCCQPLMDRLGVAATARASIALYNTREDIDALAAALDKVREVFA